MSDNETGQTQDPLNKEENMDESPDVTSPEGNLLVKNDSIFCNFIFYMPNFALGISPKF